MKKIIYILGLILLTISFGCKNNETDTRSFGFQKAALDGSELDLEPKAKINIDRKLIKEGHIEFASEDLNETRKRILQAIDKFKGYASSDNEYKSSYETSNIITIRIPAENFDKLLAEIAKGVKKFDRKEISIKDVTEEFLDIKARLKTKKELENRYLEILKKANTVSEILEVEKQIGKLRSDIESVEGRLKFIENKVSFSTLTVRIYEITTERTEFGDKFKNGFKNGWESLILFFVLLTNIWPFIIIIIGLVIFLKIWKGKRKNKH